jgi:hypothetical protein
MEYILINFMLFARGNFKNVTIDLAIHSHYAPIFRLRCISIARKKPYIYLKNINTWLLSYSGLIKKDVYFCCFMCWWNILFYMCEYSDALKIHKCYSHPLPPPPPPPPAGRGTIVRTFYLPFFKVYFVFL